MYSDAAMVVASVGNSFNMCCYQLVMSLYISLFITPLLAQNEDEISCNQNDKVTIIEDLNDGWLRVAKEGGDEGYVPQSYVTVN